MTHGPGAGRCRRSGFLRRSRRGTRGVAGRTRSVRPGAAADHPPDRLGHGPAAPGDGTGERRGASCTTRRAPPSTRCCAPAARSPSRSNQEFIARTVHWTNPGPGCWPRAAWRACCSPRSSPGDTVQGIALFGRSAAPSRPSPRTTSALAGELASRAALCLDNARLYSRDQDISLTLQRALLPSCTGDAARTWTSRTATCRAAASRRSAVTGTT